MNNINISAKTMLVSFQLSKMHPFWLIPGSQVREWWRGEIWKRFALVQAEAPSHTPHQMIRISWLGLFNVTRPASSFSSDHSCCCWLCRFISPAFEHHAAMISSQTEPTVSCRVLPWLLSESTGLFSVHTWRIYFVLCWLHSSQVESIFKGKALSKRIQI